MYLHHYSGDWLQKRVWWTLRWHEGRPVKLEWLIDVCYGDDPDGALYPEDCIRHAIRAIRRKMRGYYTITNDCNTYYTLEKVNER